jgi:ketosteroid isomerase-like protein
MRAIATLVCVLVASVLTMSASAQSGDAKAGIAATNKKWEQAWAKADAAMLSSLYTANAWLLPPNGAMAKGKAVADVWKSVLGSGGTTIALTTQELEVHGDTAHEVGAYEIKAADGTTADKGKFVVIWKREGGDWKLHRDIWNSDMPPAEM